MSDVVNTLLNIRVKKIQGVYVPNKPLLILFALARCQQGKDRLAPFSIYDQALKSISHKFGNLNALYPFGRLTSDGVWEIENSHELSRNNSGDLFYSELFEKSIHGGFTAGIYETLTNDPESIIMAANGLLEKFISAQNQETVISEFNLSKIWLDYAYSQGSVTSVGYLFERENMGSIDESVAIDQETKISNDFISYINSLHNLVASGANALAESQALSPYFPELYVRFPLIDTLAQSLTDGVPRVVILSGHAGDGKTTVALDVLKRLKGLPAQSPLAEPMQDREEIEGPKGPISLIKDMSELSAESRQERLRQAFKEAGSWFIISNTGPLLSSLSEYAEKEGLGSGIESDILDRLDRSLNETSFDDHILDGFGKELVILNLTRWNNLALVRTILSQLVNHSGWGACAQCDVKSACPLMLNRKSLRDAEAVVGDRVRWVYQRLNAYEQRLTLRQIVAQLALGLTGGMSCTEAREQVEASTADGIDRGSAGLELLLFSEVFFGYHAGRPWPDADGLHGVALSRRVTFGAPAGVEYDSLLKTEVGIGWASLPPSLNALAQRWQHRAAEQAGVAWRFALRRMLYLFGVVKPGHDDRASLFLDGFLQSPSLRELDRWQMEGSLSSLSASQRNRLKTSCLRVLLEVFSGYNPRQFTNHNALYLTLRRPDRAVVQATQLVIESLSFQDFDLRFDSLKSLLVLSFKRGKAELDLKLPLLDFIRRRDAGELGNALSPIHQNQLDGFRARLLQVTAEQRMAEDEITLLRAGIDGEVQIHRFLLDTKKNILEQG